MFNNIFQGPASSGGGGGKVAAHKMKLPATVNCWVHNEDLDTNAGAGALAASLAGGQLGVTLATADNLQCPRPVQYLGFIYGDEQGVSLADADGAVTVGNKRAFEIPLELDNPYGWSDCWLPSCKLASNETVTCTARSTSNTGEQHTAIHYVDDPGLGAAWIIKPVGGGDCSMRAAQVTATAVANTISGFTDICGRTTAYVAAQRAIPNSSTIGVNLYAVTPFCSAGYSGIALRHPSGSRQLVLPAAMGRVSGGVGALATMTHRFDFTEIFGGGLYFTADQPITLGSFGVGTTAQWALLEMELYNTGIDG